MHDREQAAQERPLKRSGSDAIDSLAAAIEDAITNAQLAGDEASRARALSHALKTAQRELLREHRELRRQMRETVRSFGRAYRADGAPELEARRAVREVMRESEIRRGLPYTPDLVEAANDWIAEEYSTTP